MSHRLTGCLVLFTVLVFGVACTKLGEPGVGEQKLAVQELARPDSIPADWGKLVSVSSVPGVEHWAQLWFQNDEGVIRIVRCNARDHFLSKRAWIIHRD